MNQWIEINVTFFIILFIQIKELRDVGIVNFKNDGNLAINKTK